MGICVYRCIEKVEYRYGPMFSEAESYNRQQSGYLQNNYDSQHEFKSGNKVRYGEYRIMFIGHFNLKGILLP